MTDLSTLKGIGVKSAGWLEDVGIRTNADLEEVGVVEAYRRVKMAYPDRVTLNLLRALQGALYGIPWNMLPDDMKAELRQQVEDLSR